MPVNKEHIFDTGIYFVTFTNYKWLPLFQITNGYEFVYKWFDRLKERGNSVLGFVIMPNHVHVLVGYRKAEKSINTIVGNGKRFMAYDIVDRIKEIGNAALLKSLSEGVTPSDWRKGKLHEVFKESFDIKLCRTYKFVAQKLDYIHSNPVSKKWSLAADPTLYEHSSARFYATGTQGRYAVAHGNDWIFENWRDETSSEGKSAIEP
jgi:REP element-mobilizing transposase RayT